MFLEDDNNTSPRNIENYPVTWRHIAEDWNPEIEIVFDRILIVLF
jgi:hypothetical protein